MKLTKKMIDTAKHPTQGQTFLRDDQLRGFALRMTSSAKSFVLERSIHGQGRRMTLGRYGDLTLEQARDLAKVKIGEIAKGNDPVETRRAQRQIVTWGELERLYLERHAVHKKSKSNDVGILKNHLADWRRRRH